MPDVSLNATDAAQLAEILQSLSEWLACDPAPLAASLAAFVGHPPTAWTNCTATWSGSSSCSAAATARSSSANDHLARACLAVTLIAAEGHADRMGVTPLRTLARGGEYAAATAKQ